MLRYSGGAIESVGATAPQTAGPGSMTKLPDIRALIRGNKERFESNVQYATEAIGMIKAAPWPQSPANGRVTWTFDCLARRPARRRAW